MLIVAWLLLVVVVAVAVAAVAVVVLLLRCSVVVAVVVVVVVVGVVVVVVVVVVVAICLFRRRGRFATFSSTAPTPGTWVAHSPTRVISALCTCPAADWHTRSRASSQHCTHAWHMASIPAHARHLSTVHMPVTW